MAYFSIGSFALERRKTAVIAAKKSHTRFFSRGRSKGRSDMEVKMSRKKIGIPLEGFGELCRSVAAQGAVLLKNEKETLPVSNGERVAVFGRIQKDYYRSGTGSGGAVNAPYATNLLDSLRQCDNLQVDEELAAVYEEWIRQNPFDDGGGVWAGEPWSQKEMEVDEELAAAAAKRADKALVVIGRTAGESKDYEDLPGGFRLSAEEEQLLRTVTKYFHRTAVILNVSCIIDMSFLDFPWENPITAVLYVWHGGQEGGRAAADVICGRMTPCGKLADTVACGIGDYPSTANHGNLQENVYQEDIYVGYRYFETFAPKKVKFPFGFGLSYTDFSMEPGCARVKNDQMEIEVRVRNTGSRYAGKEVVQVYYSAPQGKLGRPVKELAAFAKTGLLQPGQEELVTVSFPIAGMAAYDDGGYTGNRSCYVLEKGIYEIFVGNSSRNLVRVQVVEGDGASENAEKTDTGFLVPQTRVTRRLEEACAPQKSFLRLIPGKRKEDGTFEPAGQRVPEASVSLEERIRDRLPGALTQTGNQGIRLQDVREGNASLEAFVAQLSREELAVMVRGEGMCSPRVTPGVASCFGGLTDTLQKEYGIPVAAASDGPSGIRMDVGALATQVPIGTLLACTFDEKLVEELYVMEGKELAQNEIDTLLGPGLNLHRNPLNGRNFEYFSEDPLLTGKMAAANVRGIRRGGAHATIKHFACNSQETERNKVNAAVSERALRELYLRGFEIAVKEGGADSLMTAYNPINGHWCASNYDLNTTILRNEWGYRGIVMTDWWSTMNDCVKGGKESPSNTAAMVRAQNDLYMVVDNLAAERNPMQDNTLEALEKGKLTLGELQRCVMNICRFLMNAPVMERFVQGEDEAPEHIPALPEKGEAMEKGPGEQFSMTEPGADGSFHLKWPSEKAKGFLVPGKESGAGQLPEGQFPAGQSRPYQVRVCMRFNNKDARAQSACNLLLNGIRFVTPQVSGTGGRSVVRDMGVVLLEPGRYELTLQNTKMPGIEVEWVEFVPV